MRFDYDAVVIGAGNGGLCAASKLAKEGLRVVLLEKHNLPGGVASSFVRGRFEFESALHELCDCGSEEEPGLDLGKERLDALKKAWSTCRGSACGGVCSGALGRCRRTRRPGA